MEKAGISVLRANECEIADFDWGELRWHASGSLGNSGEMTVGTARLKPGQANPRHYHPNCSEVLVVVSGGISHTLDAGEAAELGPGDTVTIPEGVSAQGQQPVRYRGSGPVHRLLLRGQADGDGGVGVSALRPCMETRPRRRNRGPRECAGQARKTGEDRCPVK